MGLAGFFSVPPADQATPRWHINATVDIAAYAFSWLWVLVPLALLPDPKPGWLGLYIFILVVTDVHRHFGLAYVYLDRQVFARFPLRFTLFPGLLLGAWALSPSFARVNQWITPVSLAGLLAGVVLLMQILRREQDGRPPAGRPLFEALAPALVVAGAGTLLGRPHAEWAWAVAPAVGVIGMDLHQAARPRRFWGSAVVVLLAVAVVWWTASGRPPAALRLSPRILLNLVAVVAGAWNIWHVLMQKYGILRMYSAKSGREAKVPGWVDRLLLFGSLPLLLLWVGLQYRDDALEGFHRGSKVLVPLLDGFAAVESYALVPAALLAGCSVGVFVGCEWRVNRLSNAPRLWMAAGTTALVSCFFFVHPLKVYLAYAFSHGLEYMVFVWAFQRRRYAVPLAHNPVLGRVLRRPWLAYGGFIGAGAMLVVMLKYYGRELWPEHAQLRLLDITTAEWVMYWGVYQSMVHFYFDGFLWKMGRPANRAHL